jgi:hypothetical protein
MENSKSSLRLSKLDIVSIAPDNLKSAPELFRLKLKVESQNFPVEEMMKTKSWGELQSTVSAYTQRLKLIENHNRLRSTIELHLYLFSAIGMFVFAIINRKKQQKLKDVKPGTEI